MKKDKKILLQSIITVIVLTVVSFILSWGFSNLKDITVKDTYFIEENVPVKSCVYNEYSTEILSNGGIIKHQATWDIEIEYDGTILSAHIPNTNTFYSKYDELYCKIKVEEMSSGRKKYYLMSLDSPMEKEE